MKRAQRRSPGLAHLLDVNRQPDQRVEDDLPEPRDIHMTH